MIGATHRGAIEVLGPWLQNNGDVLNLWAVADRFSASATLAVSSTLGLDRLPARPPLCRIRWAPDGASLATAARSGSAGGLARACRDWLALRMAPPSMLTGRGVAAGNRLSALLDCSGFAYGDVWPTARMERRAAYYRRLRRQGTRVIMLPQAFGPFRQPPARDTARRLFEQCDRIYPRDPRSRAHLDELGVADRTDAVVPDITHLVAGAAPADREAWARRVCIVPNARMLDRTSPGTAEAYRGFLLRAVRIAREQGLEPHLLVHERNDLALAEEIGGSAGGALPILSEDALTAKGMLGCCYALIGSRYHALISALSQGTPAMGTSWSHKYDELFSDYGCTEHLVSPDAEPEETDMRLRRFLDRGSRDRLATHLGARAAEKRAEVERMWVEVDLLLDGSARRGRAQ